MISLGEISQSFLDTRITFVFDPVGPGTESNTDCILFASTDSLLAVTVMMFVTPPLRNQSHFVGLPPLVSHCFIISSLILYNGSCSYHSSDTVNHSEDNFTCLTCPYTRSVTPWPGSSQITGSVCLCPDDCSSTALSVVLAY